MTNSGHTSTRLEWTELF